MAGESTVAVKPRAAPARLASLDLARGASILLVVFYHTTLLLKKLDLLNLLHWHFLTATFFFNPVRMPVFFCISGILISRKLTQPVARLAIDRVLLLWYLYVLWVVIHFVRNFLLNGSGKDESALASLLVFPDDTLWFIWALGFYVLIARLTPAHNRAACTILALGVALAINAEWLKIPLMQHQKTLYYLPFYLIGAWYPSWPMQSIKQPIMTTMVAGAVLAALFYARSYWELWEGLKLVSSLSGLVFGLSASALMANLPIFSTALQFLGRNTLPIYVGHTTFLSLLVPILTSGVVAAMPGVKLWLAPLYTVIATAFSLALYFTCKRLGINFLYALPGIAHRERLSAQQKADRRPDPAAP